MNPQSRPFAYPTVDPLPAVETPKTAAPAAAAELDSDARWNQWADQGRRDRAAFMEKARVLAMIGGIAVLAVAVVLVLVSL